MAMTYYQQCCAMAKTHFDALIEDGLVFVQKGSKRSEYYWNERDLLTGEKILEFEEIIKNRAAFSSLMAGLLEDAFDAYEDSILEKV